MATPFEQESSRRPVLVTLDQVRDARCSLEGELGKQLRKLLSQLDTILNKNKKSIDITRRYKLIADYVNDRTESVRNGAGGIVDGQTNVDDFRSYIEECVLHQDGPKPLSMPRKASTWPQHPPVLKALEDGGCLPPWGRGPYPHEL